MNMKKIISVLFCVIVGVTATFAQQAEIDVSLLEKDVSPENLQEISINRFEDPGNWETSIPGDRGLVVHRRFTGEPTINHRLMVKKHWDLILPMIMCLVCG